MFVGSSCIAREDGLEIGIDELSCDYFFYFSARKLEQTIIYVDNSISKECDEATFGDIQFDGVVSKFRKSGQIIIAEYFALEKGG